MSRLILVPQYPTKLRYQEWWIEQLPVQLGQHFDDVIILGGDLDIRSVRNQEGDFSPINDSILFETFQVREYLSMDLKPNDILLLCDISYPGFFTEVLFHKKPKKCFAICHASSRNAYDYFWKVRKIKYPIETYSARLFDAVFVATEYHKKRLKWWFNTEVITFPYPPFALMYPIECIRKRDNIIVSVARPGIQKVTKQTEKLISKMFGVPIVRPTNLRSWNDYYSFLMNSKIMLITAKEETYGYQVIDAVMNGCIPIAPNKFSYPEILPRIFLYNDVEELICIISKILDSHSLYPPKLLIEEQANQFYNNIAKRMLR
jgi:hypothetical protein